MSINARRWAWSVLGLVAIAISLSGRIDSLGERYAGDAFSQALVTFAMVRALNGVISVAQGTEVAVEPAGVGVNFTVGQILDPINDLIERFSSVMLIATSSIGLQRVLLTMSHWWGVSLALSVIVAVALFALWTPERRLFTHSMATRVLAIAVAIRFAVPVFVICTQFVTATFLTEQRNAAIDALDATRIEVEEYNQATAAADEAEEQSLIQQFSAVLSDSLDRLNISDRISELSDRISNASEHIVNLIVIFGLQTVILPLVFLWAFVGLLKALAARTTKL